MVVAIVQWKIVARAGLIQESVGVTWAAAARYNLARSLERSGLIDEAIQLYKTDGDPQEHGNRLRARLLDKRRQATATQPASSVSE